MTEKEILKTKEHIEIHARREPFAVYITQIMWKAVEELEHIAELEQENAELKEKLKPENCLKSLAKSGFVKFTCENGNEHDQLTNAKEIIKDLLSFVDSLGNYSGGIFTKAEQFIKDSEVKK